MNPPFQPATVKGIPDLPLSVVNLTMRISTVVAINPDFIEDPYVYAQKHNLLLIGRGESDTAYRSDNKSITAQNEKYEERSENYHLIQDQAVKIFVERKKTDEILLRSINVGFNHLPHANDSQELLGDDVLLAAQNSVRSEIAKLLANPENANLIIPAATTDDDYAPYWSLMEFKVFLPGLQVKCFHQLCHPSGARSQGATQNYLKLTDNHYGFELVMEKFKEKSQGILLTLRLKGRALAKSFRYADPSAKFRGEESFPRLVSFSASSLPRVLLVELSRLRGFYLPISEPPKECKKEDLESELIAFMASRFDLSPEEEVQKYFERRPDKDNAEMLLNKVKTASPDLAKIPTNNLLCQKIVEAMSPAR